MSSPLGEQKPKVVLVDFDGTLSKNNGHRGFHDYAKVLGDDPNWPIINLVKTLEKSGLKIIIVSGRKDSCKDLSIEWLNKYDVAFTDFFMRKSDDNRKDFIVKEELFNEHIKDKYDVQFVVDDRNQVVHMWRRIGLTCLQCDYGDF